MPEEETEGKYSKQFFPGDHVRSTTSKMRGWVVSGKLVVYGTEGPRIELANSKHDECVTSWFYPLVADLEKITEE